MKKLICPNCEEDITYIFDKGRKKAIEDVEKIIKQFNFNSGIDKECLLNNISKLKEKK